MPLLIEAYAGAQPGLARRAPLVLVGGFPGEWEGEHPIDGDPPHRRARRLPRRLARPRRAARVPRRLRRRRPRRRCASSSARCSSRAWPAACPASPSTPTARPTSSTTARPAGWSRATTASRSRTRSCTRSTARRSGGGAATRPAARAREHYSWPALAERGRGRLRRGAPRRVRRSGTPGTERGPQGQRGDLARPWPHAAVHAVRRPDRPPNTTPIVGARHRRTSGWVGRRQGRPRCGRRRT